MDRSGNRSTHAVVRTISDITEAVHRAKDSRFVARACPIDSEAEAKQEIRRVHERHAAATHHCYAYRLTGGPSPLERCSDAGEPAGSAGLPILSAIQSRELSQILVVVTRYFGGTKLGIGGLARAYRAACVAALEAATIVERPLRQRLQLKLPLALVGEVRALLARYGGQVIREEYQLAAEWVVELPEELVSVFCKVLDDQARGAARYATWPHRGKEE